MGGGISNIAKQELVATIRDRYQQASKRAEGRILDEFTAITGHHRKHGTRLLGQPVGDVGAPRVGRPASVLTALTSSRPSQVRQHRRRSLWPNQDKFMLRSGCHGFSAPRLPPARRSRGSS